MNNQEQQLHYLKIGYYVLGGITALFALMPLIHIGIGIAAVMGGFETESSNSGFPPEFGWLFITMGFIFFIIGQSLAAITILCGIFIKKRKHHLFVFIVGCIQCAFFPFGTILGVFTIILLTKPSVRELFEDESK
ncbi:MAG: hypothetical protein AAF558_07365 [Verrucomicrobiota bacterium]